MPRVYEASSWNTFHAPILWEEHTLAPDLYLESRGLQGRDDVALLLMLLPAVAVVWPSAVITSPRCHYQLFRPDWSDYTQAECFIHQHSTQTLEVCKQSVFCFIQFRVQPAGAKWGNKVTVTQLCTALCSSGQKWHFSLLSSVWGWGLGTRDTCQEL